MSFCLRGVQPGKFAQRLVSTGAQQDGEIEVKSGLSAGESVVSEGSVFLQFANSATNEPGMIARLVSFALSQRFLIVIASITLMIWGAVSFRKLPIDAYPDLSPPHVEIIAQWPGHAAEEVERLVTIPIEIEMNGIPRLDSLRSISLYGLSSVRMNFEYEADPYFVREQAFERVGNATMPAGVTPSLSPLFSPSGLIYRYVLQSADRSPQELKNIEDWVLERRYRAIQGVADDSGFGGTTMQYQVLLESQQAVRVRHSDRPGSRSSSATITPTRAADSIRRAASSITFAASVWCAIRPISATSCWPSTTAFRSMCATWRRCNRPRRAAGPVRISCSRTTRWRASS